jgi:DNA primase catalytic subunit
MKQILKAGIFMLACLGLSAGAQDWYHDRDARFHGEEWRGRIFEHVRVDLDHIGSAVWAAGRERRRLERTKQELAELQDKLVHGRYDEHELDDVIDSLKKSANDDRLSSRDRDVLNDDMNRLRDYREHHEHWGH